MKFQTARKLLQGIPYILPELALELYEFIIRNKPEHCLELGFGHGASSCYMAAALDEVGSGHLTTVDRMPALEWQHPAIEELLEQTGLAHLVSIRREQAGYTWFLQKQIYENSRNGACMPCYDFCFIDGAKNWTIDSSAFFLVDKLLKDDSWILFDDLQWTYRSKLREGKTKSDGISLLTMDDDELDRPHLELIFQLLVMQHPAYSNFMVRDYWWAWAQKSAPGRRTLRMEVSERCKKIVHDWEEKHGRKYRKPFEPYDS